MGTLVIRIPEDVNAEYELSNSEIVKKLFNILNLKAEKPKNIRKDRLAGLFEDNAELIDNDPLGDDLFGIWKDNDATENVNQYVRNLRQGRQFYAH